MTSKTCLLWVSAKPTETRMKAKQQWSDNSEGIDRHPPLGYYNYAASYHVAADLLAEKGLRATHPAAPAEVLYYHAKKRCFGFTVLHLAIYKKSVTILGPCASVRNRMGSNSETSKKVMSGAERDT
jgi:hypothetical protein